MWVPFPIRKDLKVLISILFSGKKWRSLALPVLFIN